MSTVEMSRHGANASVVSVGSLRFMFSYEMVVAFYEPGNGWCCSENVWTTTTGRHMGMLVPRRKEVQVPNNEFEERLQAALGRIGVQS